MYVLKSSDLDTKEELNVVAEEDALQNNPNKNVLKWTVVYCTNYSKSAK